MLRSVFYIEDWQERSNAQLAAATLGRLLLHQGICGAVTLALWQFGPASFETRFLRRRCGVKMLGYANPVVSLLESTAALAVRMGSIAVFAPSTSLQRFFGETVRAHLIPHALIAASCLQVHGAEWLVPWRDIVRIPPAVHEALDFDTAGRLQLEGFISMCRAQVFAPTQPMASAISHWVFNSIAMISAAKVLHAGIRRLPYAFQTEHRWLVAVVAAIPVSGFWAWAATAAHSAVRMYFNQYDGMRTNGDRDRIGGEDIEFTVAATRHMISEMNGLYQERPTSRSWRLEELQEDELMVVGAVAESVFKATKVRHACRLTAIRLYTTLHLIHAVRERGELTEGIANVDDIGHTIIFSAEDSESLPRATSDMFIATAKAGTKDVRPELMEEDSSHLTCVVCIEDYSEGDALRQLPCGHAFHDRCIRDWLASHTECPCCRKSMLPGSASMDGEEAQMRLRDVARQTYDMIRASTLPEYVADSDWGAVIHYARRHIRGAYLLEPFMDVLSLDHDAREDADMCEVLFELILDFSKLQPERMIVE